MSIRPLARLAAVLVLTAFGSVAAHAYDKIIVFGDSYNDVGNLTALAAKYGFVYPPAPYYPGHFSNGPIWIEDVASDWKLPMLPSSAGGTDYAFAGADLLEESTTGGLPTPSVLDEVAEYLAANGGKADPHALYVIEGGGNDILDATELNAAKLESEIAKGLHEMETSLRKAGAKSFLIPELIDVGSFRRLGCTGQRSSRLPRRLPSMPTWGLIRARPGYSAPGHCDLSAPRLSDVWSGGRFRDAFRICRCDRPLCGSGGVDAGLGVRGSGS